MPTSQTHHMLYPLLQLNSLLSQHTNHSVVSRPLWITLPPSDSIYYPPRAPLAKILSFSKVNSEHMAFPNSPANELSPLVLQHLIETSITSSPVLSSRDVSKCSSSYIQTEKMKFNNIEHNVKNTTMSTCNQYKK